MPVKKYKPTSAARRFMTTMDFSELSKTEPEKSLVEVRKKHAGRNFNGHITVRHRGGGTRKRYRLIDFKRSKDGIPARVATLEYDPNRSARIALVSLSGRRKALHSCAARSADRRQDRVGAYRGHQNRQLSADQEHSARYRAAQHRAAAR